MLNQTKSVDEILAEYQNSQQNDQQQGNEGGNEGGNPNPNPNDTLENGGIPVVPDPNKSVDDILNSGNPEDQTQEVKDAAKGVTDVANTGNAEDKLDESTVAHINTLIENGKLFGFDDDKGYETVSDLVNLIDANQELWRKNISEEVNNNFYSDKSPAWQAVLQYAEMVQQPEELIPFLQVVDDIEYSNNLDVEKENDQEEIIRAVSSIKGLSHDIIEADISDYKERGNLKDRAEMLKPILDDYNAQRAQQMIAEKQQKAQEQEQVLQNHYNLIEEKIIRSSDLGGINMKNEDRQLIASALVPDNTGNLPIFTMIDNLFTSGNFDLLSKAVLMMSNEESFNGYYMSNMEGNMANNMQRVLRTANEKNKNTTSAPSTQNTSQPSKRTIENRPFTLS